MHLLSCLPGVGGCGGCILGVGIYLDPVYHCHSWSVTQAEADQKVVGAESLLQG